MYKLHAFSSFIHEKKREKKRISSDWETKKSTLHSSGLGWQMQIKPAAQLKETIFSQGPSATLKYHSNPFLGVTSIHSKTLFSVSKWKTYQKLVVRNYISKNVSSFSCLKDLIGFHTEEQPWFSIQMGGVSKHTFPHLS